MRQLGKYKDGMLPQAAPASHEGLINMRLAILGKYKVVTIAFATAFVLGVIAVRVWLFPQGMEACATQVSQTVPGPGIYDIKVLEEACDGIAGSDTMSVVLSSHSLAKDRAVFVYERKNADPRLSRQDVPPTVTWLDKDEVEVSIDMVSYIRTTLDQADGVKIHYSIGAVEYK
jgi:hypothetical protein